MNYIKVTYGVGNSFIKSTFEDNSTYVKTSVNSTFIKVAYDGGDAGLDAERLRTKVYNVTGSTLAKGTVVYINGTHGNLPSIAKAIATSDATSAQTMGLVLEDITDNKSGYIILAGKLSDLNTQAIPNGSQLYLSATVAGGYTTTKQYAPNHLVYIGVVNRSHPTQGEIEVKIQNGYEADEIHDFAVRNPSNNDGIFYNSTTSLWEKKQVSAALGYTPVPTSRTITINGVSYDLSADRSYTIAAGISGSGASGQLAFWNGASSLTGVNGLFWDNASGRLGVGTNTPSKTLTVAGDALINGITVGLGGGAVGSNVGIGANVLLSNTTGFNNVAIGYSSMYYNLNGNQNVAIGLSSLAGNNSGDNNVALGQGALQLNFNGYNNTAIGYWAGYSSTTNNSNKFGANNIFIGYESIGESESESNRTWIGNASTTSTWVGGDLLVGTRTDNGTDKLQVVGSARISGNLSLSTQFLYNTSTHTLSLGSNTATTGNRIFFNYAPAYGGDFTSQLAGVEQLSFGFNNTNQFGGGTAGTASGRTFYFYDRVNSIFFGGYSAINGFYFGQSDTRYGLRIENANASITGMTIKSGGNVLIGGTSDNGVDKVQISGTLKVTSYATFGSAGNAFIFDGNGVRTDRTGFGVIRDGVNYNFYVSPVYGQNTSGTINVVSTPTNYQPTSGTAIYNTFVVNATVNQTGGANGITRGVYVAPALTSAFDWRSIQWDNNSGWGLYGAGTAQNYIGGNLLVGTTSNPSNNSFVVNGNAAIGATASNVTFISGYNNQIIANRFHLYSTPTNIRGINSGSQGWILSKSTGLSDLYPSSIFAIDSTNQGFLPPRMTTTQKNAIATPTAGLVVYDTTLNKLCVYTTTWETITST